jgi:DNA uptake protein ComE-like DNA-binding protein
MNRPITPMTLLGSAALLAALAACSTSGDRARGADSPSADTAAATAAAPAATPAAQGTGATAAQGAMLDPNSATAEELRAVPGLSTAAADALVAGRPYADMRAVDRVLVAQRLSEPQRDTVYARLWKPIDLNSATAEEILLIPGVGPRMRHEFEEYRPYRSIEQFRREIGKYVSRDEVARLERYVTIR